MIESVEHCKTEFERARRLRRDEPLPLNDLRWQALDRFLASGFPRLGDPGWERTDASPIAGQIYTLANAPVPGQSMVESPCGLPDSVDIPFVNGHYVPASVVGAPAESRLVIAPISRLLGTCEVDINPYFARLARPDASAFVALNMAFFEDGAAILIDADTALDQPIHVRFLSNGETDCRPAMSHPRVLVVLGDGSRATVIESHHGSARARYLTNAVTEIVVGNGASLDYYRLQCDSVDAYHVGSTWVTAGRNATCRLHSSSMGAALARTDVVCMLAEAGGVCCLTGLDIAAGRSVVDTHAAIEQRGWRSRSRQRHRTVVAEEARAVFDSRVIAGRHAERSDYRQSHRTLLLTPSARVESAFQAFTSNDEGLVPGESRAGSCSLLEAAASEARREATAAFAAPVLRSIRPPGLAACLRHLLGLAASGNILQPEHEGF